MKRTTSATPWRTVSSYNRAAPIVVVTQRGTRIQAFEDQSTGLLADQQDLARRHRDALATCARVLLSAEDLSQVDEALSALLAATDATSIFIEVNVVDETLGPCSTMLREISTSGVDQNTANWSLVPWAQMPESHGPLSRGEPYAFLVSELDPIEKALYSNVNALSELDVPFSVGGEWIGLIGLSDDRTERAWRLDEVGLMVAAAQMLEAFWERKMANEAAERMATASKTALKYQRALVASSRALLTVPDERDAFAVVLQALTKATSADYGFVERNEEHADVGLCSRTVLECDQNGPEPDGDEYWELVPWSRMPDSYAHLSQGKPFAFAIEDLSETERTLYTDAPHFTRCEINLPIFVDGTWEGLVGFASASTVRNWTAEEIDLLAAIADLIGAHWARTRAQDKLAQLVAAKDTFLASVSHELRTPLTVVVGLAAELKDHAERFDAANVREFIDIIARQSMDLADIVDDLLIAARLDGEIHMLPSRIDLGIEVNAVVEALGMDEVRVTGGAAAWADSSRVRQIVRNLLTNARRYGGPNVHVELSIMHDLAIIRVIDDGAGVSDAAVDMLFVPYQSGQHEPTQPDAIGLGLSISKALATRMGGDLRYTTEDGRTVFSLALPRTPAGT